MNHRHPDADTNDQYPKTREQQERDEAEAEFTTKAIEPVRRAEYYVFGARVYLRGCYGHSDIVERLQAVSDELEDIEITLQEKD